MDAAVFANEFSDMFGKFSEQLERQHEALLQKIDDLGMGIAGVMGQLYHGYKEMNSGQNPPSGLIKCILLNSLASLYEYTPLYTPTSIASFDLSLK